MKIATYILILIISMLHPTFAPAASLVRVPAQHGAAAAVATHSASPYTIFPTEKDDTEKPGKRKWHREDGWRGVVALLLAIVAYLFLSVLWITWLPATLAVITGIGGLRHRRRNKILAALGLAGGAYVLYLWLSTVLTAIL